MTFEGLKRFINAHLDHYGVQPLEMVAATLMSEVTVSTSMTLAAAATALTAIFSNCANGNTIHQLLHLLHRSDKKYSDEHIVCARGEVPL